MRETKFRAWHKNLNKMLDPKDWHHYGPALIYGELKSGDHVIQQYTGLKDRNGKEIYEADIILIKERNANFPSKWIVIYNDEQLGFRLRWEQRFINKESGFYDVPPTPNNYEQFEVIGNIFENPELLKS